MRFPRFALARSYSADKGLRARRRAFRAMVLRLVDHPRCPPGSPEKLREGARGMIEICDRVLRRGFGRAFGRVFGSTYEGRMVEGLVSVWAAFVEHMVELMEG